MKLTKQTLQKLIKQELRHTALFEDADATKVDFKRFPLKLSVALKSRGPVANRLATGGLDDGASDDDNVPGGFQDNLAVGLLKPSQTSMDINKAVNFAIAALRRVKPFPNGPGGNLNAIVTSDNHIMDGHHRWVATGMIDPAAEVGAEVLEFPARPMIAALNMITVKLRGGKPDFKGKEGSGDFSQFNEAGIKAQLQNPAKIWAAGGDPAALLAALEAWTGQKGPGAIDVAAKKMASNVAELVTEVPGDFPDRSDMPVLENSQGHVMQAVNLLRSGAVDLNEPYYNAGGDKQEQKREETIDESWQRLAGLSKLLT
jgi:hypothetical protein